MWKKKQWIRNSMSKRPFSNFSGWGKHSVHNLYSLWGPYITTGSWAGNQRIQIKGRKSFRESRDAVKLLGSEKVTRAIKSCDPNAIKAVLDNDTRWHSTLDMLLAIKILKVYAVALQKINLSAANWDLIYLYNESLMPAKIATKSLQSESLVLFEFYLIWVRCLKETEKVQTVPSELIVKYMRIREPSLLKIEALLASIYVDHRCNIL